MRFVKVFFGYRVVCVYFFFFFFSSRRRHTRFDCDWSSDVCSSDLSLSVTVALHVENVAGTVRFREAALSPERAHRTIGSPPISHVGDPGSSPGGSTDRNAGALSRSGTTSSSGCKPPGPRGLAGSNPAAPIRLGKPFPRPRAQGKTASRRLGVPETG